MSAFDPGAFEAATFDTGASGGVLTRTTSASVIAITETISTVVVHHTHRRTAGDSLPTVAEGPLVAIVNTGRRTAADSISAISEGPVITVGHRSYTRTTIAPDVLYGPYGLPGGGLGFANILESVVAAVAKKGVRTAADSISSLAEEALAVKNPGAYRIMLRGRRRHGVPPTVDLSEYVLANTLRYENNGMRSIATATFEIDDLDGSITVLEPEAEVEAFAWGNLVISGTVRSRTRTTSASGAVRRYSIGLQDHTALLADDVIDDLGVRSTVESDKARIEYWLATYGTKGVVSGATVQTIMAAAPEQDVGGMTLYEAIADLCGLTGGRFYVESATRQLHYFASETYPAPFNFSDTPDNVTTFGYSSLVLPDDTVELTNAVFVIGGTPDDGSPGPLSGWFLDAVSIGLYERHNGTLRDPDLTTATQMASAAAAFLAERAYPRQAATLTTDKAGIFAGMTLTVTNSTWGLAAAPFTVASVAGQAVSDQDFTYELQLENRPVDLGSIIRGGDSDATRRIARSVNVASDYAASLRGRVIVVAVLPALPDPDYPQGQLVMLTTDGKLYRNTDGVTWVRAVDGKSIDDGGDVLANSITAGAIAAGAIGADAIAAHAVTTDKLEVGIQITLADEFGYTVATPSGFSGSWADFVANGIYNSVFGAGSTGAVTDGRTSILPYWTVARSSGLAYLQREADPDYPSGYRLSASFGAAVEWSEIVSDPVQIIGGRSYALTCTRGAERTAGDLYLGIGAQWYDENMAFISQMGGNETLNSAVTAAGPGQRRFTGIAPASARYAKVVATFQEDTSHNANNRIYLGGVALTPIIPTADVVAIPFLYTPATASLTDVQMKAFDLDNPSSNPWVHIPWKFSVVGISIRTSVSRSAGSAACEVWIGGSPTGFATGLNAANPTYSYATQVDDWFTGSAGTSVGMRLSTTAGWLPTSATIYGTIWLEVTR